MQFYRRFVVAFSFSLFFANSLLSQEGNKYVMIEFDEKGKLQDAKAWNGIKEEITNSKPNHLFMVVHGWKNKKTLADETFARFAELLREQQGKDESIQVIGIRWPSHLSEDGEVKDEASIRFAKFIAERIVKTDSFQTSKNGLKKLLKSKTVRIGAGLVKYSLPENDEIDALIDNMKESENIEKVLVTFTYYQMKKRAEVIGKEGMQACLTELQESLPHTRFHLVGHSFGCKVCLACLGCEARAHRQVDSLTLLQGAVSMLCFAPKVDGLENTPSGAYVEVPKRVKGCISVTYTGNDKALTLAYVAASQAAGQVAEVPNKKYQVQPGLYGTLGAKGVMAVEGMHNITLGKNGTIYPLRAGFNNFNADKIIESHGHVRTPDVAWLIWSTARYRP